MAGGLWKSSLSPSVWLLGLLVWLGWGWTALPVRGQPGVTTAIPVFRRVPFTSLATPINGTLVYCTDCTEATSPCSGSGAGAFAFRQQGAWQCLDQTGVSGDRKSVV